MTTLIINLPHLQSRRQRHGAMLLSLLCWAWFLMPLVTLGGWLLGFRFLAQEVVWLGGWRSLQQLVGTAAGIVLSLVAMWTVWTLFDMRRRRQPAPQPATGLADVPAAFGVAAADLDRARAARLTTVHFDNGKVAAVVPDPAAGWLAPHPAAPLAAAG